MKKRRNIFDMLKENEIVFLILNKLKEIIFKFYPCTKRPFHFLFFIYLIFNILALQIKLRSLRNSFVFLK